MITWGLWYWPRFLIASSLWLLTAFGIPEAIGLATNAHNTLSAYSRAELHVTLTTTVHTLAWYLSFTTWMIFVIWITAHIWFVQFG